MYYVGFIMRLGTEDNIRQNGLSTMGDDGKIRQPTIGHAGGEGVNANFSDFSEHNAVCTKIENNKVFMKCACNLRWNFLIK